MGQKKNLRQTKFLDQEQILGKKKFFDQKKVFGTKKSFWYKKLCSKIFCPNGFGKKHFSRENFGQEKLFIQKNNCLNFKFEKFLGTKFLLRGTKKIYQKYKRQKKF